MLVSLFVAVCVLFVVSLAVLSTWMKIRVNEELPEDRRLSWWSRDSRQVERIYHEQHPESIVPDLTRYGGYIAIALFAAMVLVGIIQREK